MKEILTQYAAYNLWANQQLMATVAHLSEAQCNQEINSSFKTIKLTLQHLKDVEWIWWQRMRLVETLRIDESEQTVAQISKDLLGYSRQWQEWVEKSTNAAFEHEFVYRNTKKEQFKQPVYQMLIHLFNHQTHHRGQLITMLRQVGVQKIPAMDFINHSRKK